MMDCESITLENGKEYILLAETEIEKVKYYLLYNPTDKYDYVFRKEQGEDLIGLDDEDEFAMVAAKFYAEKSDDEYVKSFLKKMLTI